MLFGIFKKAVISARERPEPLLSFSPNSAFRLLERLSGSPAFGSRISSRSTAFSSSASATRASSSSRARLLTSFFSMGPASSVPILALSAARAQEATMSPDAMPSLRAMPAQPMPLALSLRASRLVASG